MKLRCTKEELFLVAAAVVMSFVLRASKLDRLAVEHFDEGIYASATWYDAMFPGQTYPMRHLYAPPLLPKTIQLLANVPSLRDVAPFLPSVTMGIGTVLAVWWVTRLWFGMCAGLFIVFVAAFSDFHIMFSRMALTDVPAMFWTVLAVGIASRSLNDTSTRGMIFAGICVGLAWWTKYTGWLALAIVGSGTVFWWCLAGRKTLAPVVVIKLLLTLGVTAVAVWAPWYFMLQKHGGYEAVAANHAGYFQGTTGWQDRLANHILCHFRIDSWFGAASIGLAILAAGTRRWIELRRSKWTDAALTIDSGTPDSSSPTGAVVEPDFPGPALLGRFVGAAVLLLVVASGVGAVGLLTCIGIGGMAGMFLWPILADLYRRRTELDQSPPIEGAAPFRQADLLSGPSIDPLIGTCFTVSWFCGMIVMTPMYSAFPRLSLPFLVSAWLAAAGGIGWWMEANLNVHRRGEDHRTKRPSAVRRIVRGMSIVALALAVSAAGSFQPPLAWQRRTSLRDASWHAAQTVLDDVAGEQRAASHAQNDTNEVTMKAGDNSGTTVASETAPNALAELQAAIVKPFDTSSPLADIASPTCAIYTFGEPAVLAHLNAAGVPGVPVQDTKFSSATFGGNRNEPVPTYLLFGPNALRTDGMMNEWALTQYRFEHIADFHFAPGEIVLYNLFSPEWVGQHFEASVQMLELYRLKPRH